MSSKSILLIFFVSMILLFPMGITSVNATSSDDVEYIFTQFSNNVSISRPCFNTGVSGWCSAGAICSVVVYDPYNVVFLRQNMTNQISFHNVSLPQLNQTGVYKVDMVCSDSNQTGYNSFWFGVTKDGPSSVAIGSNIGSVGGLIFVMGTLLALLVIFIFLAYNTENALKVAFLLLTVLMLPIILWVALNTARSFGVGTSIISVLSTGFVVSLIAFGAMVLYVCWTLMMQFKIKKTMSVQKQPGNPSYWNKRQESKQRRTGEEYQ